MVQIKNKYRALINQIKPSKERQEVTARRRCHQRRIANSGNQVMEVKGRNTMYLFISGRKIVCGQIKNTIVCLACNPTKMCHQNSEPTEVVEIYFSNINKEDISFHSYFTGVSFTRGRRLMHQHGRKIA